MFENNIIRSFSIFERKERKKIYIVMLIQVLLGALDLIGVVMLGLLGSRVISGSSNQPIGDRTAKFLDFLGLLEKYVLSKLPPVCVPIYCLGDQHDRVRSQPLHEF
jgi:hypothetical protein